MGLKAKGAMFSKTEPQLQTDEQIYLSEKYFPQGCPYCGSTVNFTNSEIIYKKDYGMMYICTGFPLCQAWVGVHRGSNIPLGRIADEELRKLKKQAHSYLDQLWQGKPSGKFKDGIELKTLPKMSRAESYKVVQDLMQMSKEEAHIGMFDNRQCKLLIKKLKETYY